MAIGRIAILSVLAIMFVSLNVVGMDNSISKYTDIDVSVKLVEGRDNDSVDLQIRMKLLENNKVEIYEDELPWKSLDSITLVAVADDAPSTVIPKKSYFSDIGLGLLILNPNEEVEGNISLANRFPSLYSVLSKHNVILFWSYQLKPINSFHSKRYGGWILIPKREQE